MEAAKPVDHSHAIWRVRKALEALRDLSRLELKERGAIAVDGEALSALFDILSDELERTLN